MKIEQKNKARALRKEGLTLNQIIEKTGFSKASVSIWVRDVVLTESQKIGISKRGRSKHSIELRRKSRLANAEKKREKIIYEAKKDFLNIDQRELKIIGAMLYLGEGRKTGHWTASVTNSDPNIIKIMMRFFREICLVPDSKFRAHIHAFEGADENELVTHWSSISGIPKKQFYKTYTKPSVASKQKRKTLPYGTLDVYVNDTKVFLTIKGWIKGIVETALRKF